MLCFGPKVILANAFHAVQETDRACRGITFDGLRHFCNMLRDSIPDEKYIQFRLSEPELDDFCERADGFTMGIGKVWAVRLVEDEDLASVNRVYEEHVRNALAAAREKFLKEFGGNDVL